MRHAGIVDATRDTVRAPQHQDVAGSPMAHGVAILAHTDNYYQRFIEPVPCLRRRGKQYDLIMRGAQDQYGLSECHRDLGFDDLIARCTERCRARNSSTGESDSALSRDLNSEMSTFGRLLPFNFSDFRAPECPASVKAVLRPG